MCIHRFENLDYIHTVEHKLQGICELSWMLKQLHLHTALVSKKTAAHVAAE